MLVLPKNSGIVWKRFLQENKALVYKYIIRQMKTAIQEEKDRLDLFKFEENDKIFMWVESKDYLKLLTDAFDLFMKEEEYEYASKTKKLITLHQINSVIRDSIKLED